jgi:hypothetical protein
MGSVLWRPVEDSRFDDGDIPRRLCPKQRLRADGPPPQPRRGFFWQGSAPVVRPVESSSDKASPRRVIRDSRANLRRLNLPTPLRPLYQVAAPSLALEVRGEGVPQGADREWSHTIRMSITLYLESVCISIQLWAGAESSPRKRLLFPAGTVLPTDRSRTIIQTSNMDKGASQ